MKEQWKKIKLPNIYDYYISNLGNIKAGYKEVVCSNGKIRKYKEKNIKPRIDPKGYQFITLYGHQYNRQFRIHTLVALAFIPNPENKPCVNHKDSVRTNNKVNNLEWVTHSENTMHAYLKGVIKPPKKLTESAVEDIRILHKQKEKQHIIAKKFNISQTQVSRIVNYINWS